MIELAYIVLISLTVLGAIRILLPLDLQHLLGAREFAAAVVLPTIATLSPTYPVFALLVVGFVALTPASLEQRGSLLLFSVALLPLLALVIKAPAPINQLVRVDYQILLFIGLIPAIMLSKRLPNKLRRWDVLLCMLMGLFIFINSRGTSITNVLRESVQALLGIGLPYFVVSRSIASEKQLGKLLLSFVFGAALIGSIATFESFRDWLLYAGLDLGQDPSALSGYAKQRAGFLRAQATFPEPTSLAIFLSLALVVCFALRENIERRSVRFCLYALLGFGLLFTFARVGPLILATGIFAVVLFERRYAFAAVLIVTAPIAWGLLQFISRVSPAVAGMLGMTEDAYGTVEYRRTLSARLFEIIRDNPLFGIDSKQISTLLADLRQGEGIIDLVNAPLVIASQAGVLGLFVFLLPTIAACRALLTERRNLQPKERHAASALFATLISLNVGLVTTSLGARNLLWLTILIGATAGTVRRRAIKRTPIYTGSDHPMSIPTGVAAK